MRGQPLKTFLRATETVNGLWPRAPGRFSALGLLILVVACAGVLRAADPYAEALDKRFATAETPTPEQAAAVVASLEQGVRQQAKQMSTRPEPEAQDGSEQIERLFLWAFGLLGAVSVPLFAVLALRRWNQHLDNEAAKQERALADDPLMAEFLRTLHEDLKAGPLVAPEVKPNLAEALPEPGTPVPEPIPPDPALVVGKNLSLLRSDFHRLGRCSDDPERLTVARQLLQLIELVKQGLSSPHLHSAKLLSSALHGLLKQLSLNAKNITPSALRTAASAIDLLELLYTRGSRPDLATVPPVRLLAVDDDVISLRAVSLALKKAFNDSDLAPDGPTALGLADRQSYDVVFLDIEMPGMDGFEVCSKLHKTALNSAAPVVFVTSHSDFESRAKSALSGAQDLIGKPFLAFEITVKALTLVLRGRLEREAKRASGGAEKPDSSPAALKPKAAGPANPVARPACSPCQPVIV